MNGKNVLHGFDLDDRHFFDKEIDTVTELNRHSVVSDGKSLFDLEADAECVLFVRHTNPIRPLQQSWPQFGTNLIDSAEDAVRDAAMDEIYSVSSVRVSALRGSACGAQGMGRF